jgi:isopenicillin-N epimerase
VIYAYHYKWLCAPKGAGFLYARPEVQHLLKPLVVSWGYEAERPSPSQFVNYQEWQGTRDIAAFLSVPAAIEFQKEQAWNWVQAGCHVLAAEVEARLREMTGLPSLYANEDWFAQMVSAMLPPETDILALKKYLYDERRIEVPLMEWNGRKLIRISIQGYNSREDVEALIKALGDWFGG